MNTFVIIAQIIGILAFLASCFSYIAKKKSGLLFFQILANVMYFLEYIFLGAYAGAVNNVISITKFSSIAIYEKKKEKTSPVWFLIVFSIVSVVAGILTYEGVYSLVPMVTTVLFTYGLWQKNPVVTRIIGMFCATTWIVYNLIVAAYASAVFSFVEVVTGFVTMIREIRKKRAEVAEIIEE